MVLRMVPMIVVMGTIFFLSHQSFGDSPPLFPGVDKLVHMFLYGILAATVLFGLPGKVREKHVLAIALVMTTCIVYGISDEIHQAFVPNRYPDWVDVLADTIGAAVICGGWFWFVNKGKD